MTSRFWAYAAVSSAVTFWGISFVVTKVALLTLSPYLILFWRFALAALFLLPCWFRYGKEALQPRHLPFFILLGLMEPCLYFIFETWGLVYTSASAAALIIAAIPVLVTLMATVFLGEAVSRKVIAGIFLSLTGVFCLIWQGSDAAVAANGSWLGNLLILGGVFCAAVFTTVSRRLRSEYRTLTLTTFQVTLATLFFLPFAAHDWWKLETPELTPGTGAAVVFLAVFATLLAFLLYNYSLGVLEASRVSIFLNVIPLVTVLLAWIVLEERLSWLQASGGSAILAGVALTTGTGSGIPVFKPWISRFMDVLNGGGYKRALPLVAAQQHIERPRAPIPGTGRSEG